MSSERDWGDKGPETLARKSALAKDFGCLLGNTTRLAPSETPYNRVDPSF